MFRADVSSRRTTILVACGNGCLPCGSVLRRELDPTTSIRRTAIPRSLENDSLLAGICEDGQPSILRSKKDRAAWSQFQPPGCHGSLKFERFAIALPTAIQGDGRDGPFSPRQKVPRSGP